jgi:mannose-6-phosphate isomerase-like protein (cupin superfamily)
MFYRNHYPWQSIPVNYQRPQWPPAAHDYGNSPYVINIEQATLQNPFYRTALWTGKHMQLTVMTIHPGEDIGLERHPNTDQFLRVESGHGLVQMGAQREHLDYQQYVQDDFAILVPAGMWHNLINTGHTPLKLYTIYAPPEHPYGTTHPAKQDAMAAE